MSTVDLFLPLRKQDNVILCIIGGFYDQIRTLGDGDLQNILRGSFVGRLNHQCPFVGIINFLYNWTSVVIQNKLRIRRILKSDQDEVF